MLDFLNNKFVDMSLKLYVGTMLSISLGEDHAKRGTHPFHA